jgi:hypothetical protein
VKAVWEADVIEVDNIPALGGGEPEYPRVSVRRTPVGLYRPTVRGGLRSSERAGPRAACVIASARDATRELEFVSRIAPSVS